MPTNPPMLYAVKSNIAAVRACFHVKTDNSTIYYIAHRITYKRTSHAEAISTAVISANIVYRNIFKNYVLDSAAGRTEQAAYIATVWRCFCSNGKIFDSITISVKVARENKIFMTTHNKIRHSFSYWSPLFSTEVDILCKLKVCVCIFFTIFLCVHSFRKIRKL